MTSPIAAPPTFPMQLELNSPLEIARWRPFLQGIMAFPHFVVLWGLNIAAGVVAFISWWAILFSGNMPEGLFNFLAMHQRYQWRVMSYVMFMREQYPAFDFTTSAQDPGGDPATLSVQPAAKLSRGLIFIKWLLVIPQFFVLMFVGLATYVVLIVAFFAVLFTGSWPEGMRRFVVGVQRWGNRVYMYMYLMTDQYPPFSMN